MNQRFFGALAAAGIVLMAGIGTAAPASAAITTACAYTAQEPVLRQGNTGLAVKQMQCELNRSQTKVQVVVDGVFGPATRDAVYTFQNCVGLQVDGVVGAQTWAQLNDWSTHYSYPEGC